MGGTLSSFCTDSQACGGLLSMRPCVPMRPWADWCPRLRCWGDHICVCHVGLGSLPCVGVACPLCMLARVGGVSPDVDVRKTSGGIHAGSCRRPVLPRACTVMKLQGPCPEPPARLSIVLPSSSPDCAVLPLSSLGCWRVDA